MSVNIVQPHKSSLGDIDANVMALVAYLSATVLGWIPGIRYVAWLAPLVIFFLEKNSGFVKFHAMQAFVLNAISTAFFVVISVILGGIVAAALVGPTGVYAAFGALGLVTMLSTLVAIVFTVFAIIALIQAYQYKEYRIPIVGGLSDKVSGILGGVASK